jgi:hypothetical protein
MDTTKIGTIAAEAMEVFERDFSDVGDARVVEAAIVFEVRYTDEDGEDRNEVGTACTTDSRVHQTGLFDWAYKLVSDEGTPADSGDVDGEG